MKRTRIRPMSEKRQKESRQYSKQRTAFLAARPACERCNKRPSRDVHHKAGRSGSNYLDEATWAALCRHCHTAIHERPGQARAEGWLK